MIFGGYLALYTVDEQTKTVTISRIFHQTQNYFDYYIE
jgi:mRNA-degrading endonuclease RelE of RelBE toxin-antitoxin system